AALVNGLAGRLAEETERAVADDGQGYGQARGDAEPIADGQLIIARVGGLDVGEAETGVRGAGNSGAIKEPLIAQGLRADRIAVEKHIAAKVRGETDGRAKNEGAAIANDVEHVEGGGRGGNGNEIAQ